MTNYYQSPRWSGEFNDCSMPMTFDQYSNCAFGCLYCFSNYQRGIGNGKRNYYSKSVKPVNVNKIRKMFTEPDSTHFGEYIKRRIPMQWGGLSDPFCGYEKKLGVGLELLTFFREIDYPICFSTKGVWWLKKPEYTSLFKDNPNWNVKVTIINLEADKAAMIEAGTPSPRDRLKGIESIAKLNCGGATLRLRPFMLGLSNPRHRELIRLSAEHGATAVSTEFWCLEQRCRDLRANGLPIIDKVTGFNQYTYYREHSLVRGYLRLNREVKRPFVDDMQDEAHKNGMRFYVSDAHFKERCDNGSCCGLPPSWNYSRGQFCEALVRCRINGVVSWGEIAKNMAHLESILLSKAINLGSLKNFARF
ncbi:hypothetical protein LCGC14_1454900, partial [marine sediment metagenome]